MGFSQYAKRVAMPLVFITGPSIFGVTEASFKFRFSALQSVFEYDFLIFKNPNIETGFNLFS